MSTLSNKEIAIVSSIKAVLSATRKTRTDSFFSNGTEHFSEEVTYVSAKDDLQVLAEKTAALLIEQSVEKTHPALRQLASSIGGMKPYEWQDSTSLGKVFNEAVKPLQDVEAAAYVPYARKNPFQKICKGSCRT